jgi:hypothetical protein
MSVIETFSEPQAEKLTIEGKSLYSQSAPGYVHSRIAERIYTDKAGI